VTAATIRMAAEPDAPERQDAISYVLAMGVGRDRIIRDASKRDSCEGMREGMAELQRRGVMIVMDNDEPRFLPSPPGPSLITGAAVSGRDALRAKCWPPEAQNIRSWVCRAERASRLRSVESNAVRR